MCTTSQQNRMGLIGVEAPCSRRREREPAAADHLLKLGDGGAERRARGWAEPARSLERERAPAGRSAIARWSADRERL